MLKDITLGQFFPGYSAIHRLDPRTKLVMLVVYIVALFLAVNWISYALMLVFLGACIAISRIPLKSFFRGMKPLIFILAFTAILNLFFTEGENLLVSFWVITIYWEGVTRAIFMLLRIFCFGVFHAEHNAPDRANGADKTEQNGKQYCN